MDRPVGGSVRCTVASPFNREPTLPDKATCNLSQLVLFGVSRVPHPRLPLSFFPSCYPIFPDAYFFPFFLYLTPARPLALFPPPSAPAAPLRRFPSYFLARRKPPIRNDGAGWCPNFAVIAAMFIILFVQRRSRVPRWPMLGLLLHAAMKKETYGNR